MRPQNCNSATALWTWVFLAEQVFKKLDAFPRALPWGLRRKALGAVSDSTRVLAADRGEAGHVSYKVVTA